ncbi:N-acetylmuramoyl-L-alanine amidase [Streptomyces sp. NPDC015127]|uniref:peptidoglycan recognition protein family protein n=1 Tax=Streptomyces sp. NPDC015127 TaxID=3364939 RepID=UPI0036F6EE7F
MSPRRDRAARTNRARRTVWLVAGAVVLGGGGVTAVAVTGSSEDVGAEAGGRPAQAHVLALDGKDPKKRDLPRTETQLFSLVGVSWEDSADTFEGTAQIRTRSAGAGTWSDWRDLDFDIRAPESAEGDTSGVRGASEPLWVGASDAVEARVVADGEETAVPKALRLDMIDPGTTDGDGVKGGKGQTAAKPERTKGPGKPTAQPSEPVASTAPAESTGGEPTADAPSPVPSEAPAEPSAPAESSPSVSEEPPAPTAPAEPSPSEVPAESAAPAPSEEPTAAPSTGEPSAEPPVESPTPAEPTASPSEPAPSADPTDVPATDPTDGPSSAPAPSESTPAPSAPAIVSRAEWGADESLVQDPPAYLNKVDAVFVHHTAGTNNYTCAESPAIIRAILTYHVKTNGWNDVGYNFFVDKCGTVFEGRAGGVDKPVQGAHTYGFNGYSSGVSLLGDYENGGTPTAAAKKAVADISAWKLGLHGVDPQAKVTLTAAADTGVWKKGDQATLYTISGHRDGYATLCPGRTLYSALPEIRTAAGASPYAVR